MISPISGSSSNFDISRLRDTKNAQTITQKQIGNQRLSVPRVNIVSRNDTVEISARGRQALQKQMENAKNSPRQLFAQERNAAQLIFQEQEATSPDLQAQIAALAPGVSVAQNAGASNQSDRFTPAVSSTRSMISTTAESQNARPAFDQAAEKAAVPKQETTVTKQNTAIYERAVASYAQYSLPATAAQTQAAALNLVA